MTDLNQQFWNQRYAEAQTGWDIGYPAPAIQTFIDGLTDKNQRILIPGCGNAYEAEYLIEKGFTNITLIDIAPLVVEAVAQRLKPAIEKGQLKLICGDFFELNDSFDLIIEQTFFCALHPSMRHAYAKQMYHLLDAGGVLTGLLFSFPLTEDGPPFGGSKDEYSSYFSPLFTIKHIEACNHSIKPRSGRELWFELKKTKS